jgi:hypothetical protein
MNNDEIIGESQYKSNIQQGAAPSFDQSQSCRGVAGKVGAGRTA